MSSQYVPPQPPQPPAVPPQPPTAPQPPAPQAPPPRRGGEQSWAWVGGAILILIGLAVLFGNFGFVWGNWWALLFYVIAGVNFVNMARSWQRTGSFGRAATGSLTGGLVLVVIGSIFFLDLSWAAWWPLILVAAGSGTVIGTLMGAITGADSAERR